MMLCVEVKMESTKILDIIAYYLSEYDNLAFDALGYKSHKQGFDSIAPKFGKKESYLRRLRDEYDVVTSSHRNGQCNRPPRDRIVRTEQHLKTFSFDEITKIVKALIENNTSIDIPTIEDEKMPIVQVEKLTEEEIEYIINFKDNKAGIKITNGQAQRRVYKTSIIKQLKKLYKGQCQICGENAGEKHGVDISEVHHIKYFSSSQNNDSSNLIVLCPNHHRLIHKLNPTFDEQNRIFSFQNGETLKIIIDYHYSELN